MQSGTGLLMNRRLVKSRQTVANTVTILTVAGTKLGNGLANIGSFVFRNARTRGGKVYGSLLQSNDSLTDRRAVDTRLLPNTLETGGHPGRTTIAASLQRFLRRHPGYQIHFLCGYFKRALSPGVVNNFSKFRIFFHLNPTRRNQSAGFCKSNLRSYIRKYPSSLLRPDTRKAHYTLTRTAANSSCDGVPL